MIITMATVLIVVVIAVCADGLWRLVLVLTVPPSGDRACGLSCLGIAGLSVARNVGAAAFSPACGFPRAAKSGLADILHVVSALWVRPPANALRFCLRQAATGAATTTKEDEK